VFFAAIVLPHMLVAQTYQTLGPNSCGTSQTNCHVKENGWWTNDDHYATADPFFDATGKYAKIAKLYGISTADITKGNQACMACHGTVIAASAARDVEFGVSCENCHGAGSGYKDIHSEKGGYPKALQLGMIEMKNLDKRAMTCVRCHFITEPKLVSTGHPTGEDFDYVRGIRQNIAKHWKHPAESASQLQPVFERAVQARGPVQKIANVERVVLKSDADQAPRRVQEAIEPSIEIEAGVEAGASSRRAEKSMPMQSISVEPPPAQNLGQLILPPFPAINDSMSVSQVLLILKNRLELLYQMTEGR
jgi:hypothetical protein